MAAFFLNRVTISARQIGPGESLRFLVVLFVFLGFFFLGTLLYVKDWHRANFLVFLLPFCLLVYQGIFEWIKKEYTGHSTSLGLLLIPCMALLYTALASPRGWALLTQPAIITKYLYFVLLIFLGIQVLQFGKDFRKNFGGIAGSDQGTFIPVTSGITLNAGSRPDIYIIVLDGYAGQDVLKEIYQYDNSEFLGQLETRGFYISRGSHSNYVQTSYSVISLLNFEYLQPWQRSMDYYEYLVGPILHNRVFEMLQEIGYTTVGFKGATAFSQVANSDIFYNDSLPLNRFETYLLANTPVEPLAAVLNLGFRVPDYKTHRRRILDHLRTLETVPETIAGPKITYLHLLAPHPPFVFDEYGNMVEPDRPFSILDGNEFAGSTEEYWQGYRQQITFLNARILEAIDMILEKSDTPPVIILMSDHGPGSMLQWEPDDYRCLWERTNNLYALLLPDHRADPALQPGMTPVNTFRIVFNSYFGTSLPMLEDRTYFATWHYPERMIDVTDDRDSRNACLSLESLR